MKSSRTVRLATGTAVSLNCAQAARAAADSPAPVRSRFTDAPCVDELRWPLADGPGTGAAPQCPRLAQIIGHVHSFEPAIGAIETWRKRPAAMDSPVVVDHEVVARIEEDVAQVLLQC